MPKNRSKIAAMLLFAASYLVKAQIYNPFSIYPSEPVYLLITDTNVMRAIAVDSVAYFKLIQNSTKTYSINRYNNKFQTIDSVDLLSVNTKKQFYLVDSILNLDQDAFYKKYLIKSNHLAGVFTIPFEIMYTDYNYLVYFTINQIRIYHTECDGVYYIKKSE